MTTSLLSDSLIRSPTNTLAKILEWATSHIEAEEVVLRKNRTSHSKQIKRADLRYVPYVAKKNESKEKGKEETSTRPRFWVSCKELIGMPGVSKRLKFPLKTNRFLGSRKDMCDFHQAFVHRID